MIGLYSEVIRSVSILVVERGFVRRALSELKPSLFWRYDYKESPALTCTFPSAKQWESDSARTGAVSAIRPLKMKFSFLPLA